MIITIARECGSDGYTVGKILAEKYQIPLYNRTVLIQLAKEKGIYERMPNFFAENPVSSLLYAIASGEGMTNLGQVPLTALKETIGNQDCILIGRCGNYVFADRQDCCRVFLHGEQKLRTEKMMEVKGISRKKAEELVKHTDERRASFHKYYTGQVWGMAQNYDICLNSVELKAEKTAEMVVQYWNNCFSF